MRKYNLIHTLDERFKRRVDQDTIRCYDINDYTKFCDFTFAKTSQGNYETFNQSSNNHKVIPDIYCLGNIATRSVDNEQGKPITFNYYVSISYDDDDDELVVWGEYNSAGHSTYGYTQRSFSKRIKYVKAPGKLENIKILPKFHIKSGEYPNIRLFNQLPFYVIGESGNSLKIYDMENAPQYPGYYSSYLDWKDAQPLNYFYNTEELLEHSYLYDAFYLPTGELRIVLKKRPVEEDSTEDG